MTQAVPVPTSSPPAPPTIRIGTRGSPLALWQARHIQRALTRHYPSVRFSIEIVQSEGDLDKESPLADIGGRGVFTSALQRALLAGRIDMAVHSTKDLPTLSPEGLAISAFTAREDPRDVLVSRHGLGMDALPPDPVIGTSSQRRAAQVRQVRPDARIVDLRGNIDTRLGKAATDAYDAIVLAAAGLIRMGWRDRITEYLPVDRFTPSPGQGVLALETRAAPDPAAGIAASLADDRAMIEVAGERAFLRNVGGGCTAPIGAHARLETVHGREFVRFWAMLGNDDGSHVERAYDEFPTASADTSVRAISQTLMRAIAAVAPEETPAASEDRALHFRNVLVTGTRAVAEPLIAEFQAHGAIAHHVETIVVQPVADPARLHGALSDARRGEYDWMIVTSGNAVDAVAGFTRQEQEQEPEAGHWPVQVAAVGRKTATRMREIGFRVIIEPEDERGEGLIRAMTSADVSGRRALCLFGNRARKDIPKALRTRGAEVDTVEAYRTVDATEIDPKIRDLVREGEIDVVTFASPSSVRAMRCLLGTDLAALSGACLVAIGPTTAAAMTDAELPVHALATRPSADGVVEAVTRYFSGRATIPATATESEASHA